MRRYFTAIVLGLALAGCASNGVSNGAAPDGASSLPTGPGQGSVSTTSGPGMGGTPSVAPSTGASAACPTNLNIGQPNGPQSRTLPAQVSVSWVLRCTIVSKTGTARTLVTERSNSDPTDLIKALRTPSGLRPKGVCPMYRVSVPYFALVQTNGQALLPQVPKTNCGLPQPAVLAALNAMRFTVLSTKQLP